MINNRMEKRWASRLKEAILKLSGSGQSQTYPLFTLPDTVSPALPALLLDRVVRTRHVAAILFDLANRGILLIQQMEEDVIFERTEKDVDDLPLFEQLILRDIFGAHQQVPFVRLPPMLSTLMQGVTHFIIMEKNAYQKKAGRQIKRPWRQFKRQLSHPETESEPAMFGEFFGYTVAFGVEIEWARQFLPAAKKAMPDWYYTPTPEQNLAQLAHLAGVLAELLGKQARSFHLPVTPLGLAHISEGGGGSSIAG